MNKPILGITMGDPASVGPELCIKLADYERLYGCCRPVIIGDAGVLERATGLVGLQDRIRIHAIQSVNKAKFEPSVLDVLDLGLADISSIPIGQVSAAAGEAAFQYVSKGIALALAGEIDGTVTNAISKEAINLAGHHYSGHTEIYADLTGTKKYCMMLAHEDFRVTHVSTHVSLREACNRVKRDRVLEVIRFSHQACLDLNIEQPKVAVAGLNPHCGENGLFGREEIEEIAPAIQLAAKEGINVVGPVPPDTVFSQAIGGWYDIVVAMYHDQGHIPTKIQGFVYNRALGAWNAVSGVNITLGLPIVRVSVDHGTAFDHAGKGDANALSLINAVEYAARLSVKRTNL